MVRRRKVDRTVFALEAGIILGPALGIVIAVLLHWQGHDATWALIGGLWVGLFVAALVAIPNEVHRPHHR